ncbi:MAG: hypothetical protein ACQERD_05170 [Campylobacterota bacterium]
MKEELIEEIKELIKISKEEKIEINPNYLDYFETDELEDIKKQLLNKKKSINKSNVDFLDELYEKTKKNEL